MKLLLIAVLMMLAAVNGCRFACDPNEALSNCVRDPVDGSYQLFSDCRLRGENCNRNMLKQPLYETVSKKYCK